MDDDTNLDDSDSDASFEDCVMNFHDKEYCDEIQSAINYVPEQPTRYADVGLVHGMTNDNGELTTGTELLKEELKEHTRLINLPCTTDEDRNRFDWGMHLVYHETQEDQQQPIVYHDSSLNCYWSEFTTALRTMMDSQLRIRQLSIANIQLTKVVLDMLGKALRDKDLRHLTLRKNALSESDEIDSVSSQIKAIPLLETFHFCGNRISDLKTANHLLGTFMKHRNLHTIHFTHCPVNMDYLYSELFVYFSLFLLMTCNRSRTIRI